jgi:hypothetical protein
MEKLVVTPDVYAPFFVTGRSLELCDGAGHTIGYFHPANARTAKDAKLYEWAKAAVTAEELEEARASPGLRTTADVLASLREP